MKRLSAVSIFSLILALVALPAFAGAPFGSFGGMIGGGNSGAGTVPLHGWALDDGGIAAVDIYVDGVNAGRAIYGRARAQVAQLYPGYPDSAAAGWGFQLNTARFLNGLHSVSVIAISTTGEETTIGTLVFEFLNTTHNLAPFGEIETPFENTELFGTCDDDPIKRLAVVSGWVLDAGVEAGDLGVGYVELLLDGAIIRNSRTSCHWSLATGGLTDCYGLARLDISYLYPTLVDAPHAGFRFVLDIDQLLDEGRVPGHHSLTIRAGDIAGQVANVDEIPVFFFCDDYLPNEGSFGWFRNPAPDGVLGGNITMTGWALDREWVTNVFVFADGGIFLGEANYGAFRPRVNLMYPGYRNSLGAGWSLVVDTSLLSNGNHQIQVVVRDREGVETIIGERDLFLTN